MPPTIQGHLDKEHAETVIVTAIEAGVDLIDTAKRYCIDHSDFGHNERLL
jgi:aryl-alcohol dehydrogenase-like predicted oxidoreductase